MSRTMNRAEAEYHIRALQAAGFTVLTPKQKKYDLAVALRPIGEDGFHHVGVATEVLDHNGQRLAYGEALPMEYLEPWLMKEDAPPIPRMIAEKLARYMAEQWEPEIERQMREVLEPIAEKIREARERAMWTLDAIQYFIAHALAGDEPLEVIEKRALDPELRPVEHVLVPSDRKPPAR